MKCKVLIWAFFATMSIGVFAQRNEESKEDTAAIKRFIESKYIEMCVQINKQMPIRIDEITSLTRLIFVNWILTASYSIEIDMEDYDETELKDFMRDIKTKQKQRIPFMISNGDYGFTQDELYEYLKGTGLKFRFVYYDINGEQIGANSFDYNDFKPTKKELR